MKETIIEPVLDSVAGNIEIAIYMATEIEDALTDINRNKKQHISRESLPNCAERKNRLL